MMSETYEKIKENADNEWKYSRVYVVDEFVSSVFWSFQMVPKMGPTNAESGCKFSLLFSR